MDDHYLFLALTHAYFLIYDAFRRRGLYVTAELFRRFVGAPVFLTSSLTSATPLTPTAPLSPTTPLSPIDDEEVSWDSSADRRAIINLTNPLEWEALADDASSSYNDEDNMWQQSGFTPSIHHESNEQMVEERTPDEIFSTHNQGPVSLVSCVKVNEDGKTNEEESSCSQDAHLYDSSTFNLGNEDDSVICGFSFNGYLGASNSDEIQGVTVEGSSVPQTTSHPERLMLSSTPANIEDTNTPGPHSAAQIVPRTLENASNEHGDGGINMPGGNNSDSEIWLPVPVYLKNFPKHSSYCPKYEEGASCGQDAYVHDSSFNESYQHHESLKNNDSKVVMIGGELLPEIMTNTENSVMCVPAPNLDVIDSEGLDSVQGILRSVEFSVDESGRKRKWYELEDDGVSFGSEISSK